MNTNAVVKCLSRCSLMVAIAGLVWLPSSAFSQEKGAQKLMKIQTVEDVQKLDAGDTVIMSCPKCKESYATVVEKTFKTAKPEELRKVAIHLCPGCESKIVTKGTGKQAKDELVHSCKSCGSEDVTCCAMKKNASSTKGMEK